MSKKDLFNEIELYAQNNGVPIVEKEGLDILQNYVKEHNPKTVLEIGTAIGYSALKINDINDCEIITFEREKPMIEQAEQNINKFNKKHKIKIIEQDFLSYDVQKLSHPHFDLIYIDGAKAQYYNFFTHIKSKINENTIVIFDNLDFHDFVYNEEKKKAASKSLRQMINKIEKFLELIKEEPGYTFEYINKGDGLGILRKDND